MLSNVCLVHSLGINIRRTAFVLYAEKPSSLGVPPSLINNTQSMLLAYGCVNFLYYIVATVIAASVFKFEKSGSRKAYEYLGKLMSAVWLGSQATKAFRIGFAVFLTPLSDRFLNKVEICLSRSRDVCFKMMIAGILLSTLIFYVSLYLAIMTR
jgi:hypothetical protein